MTVTKILESHARWLRSAAKVMIEDQEPTLAHTCMEAADAIDSYLTMDGEKVLSGLMELYVAAGKGFHTTESCGPDGKYWYVSKFRSLEDLHAYSAAWTKAILSAAPSHKEKSYVLP